MRSDIFCIISAIKNDYGVFSYDERFNQLLETITSIKTFSPESDIVLYDTSFEPIPESHLTILKNLVKNVRLLHTHPAIQQCKEIVGVDLLILKTIGETYGFLEFLTDLKNLGGYNRIFKIGGRYKLNSNFNKQIHILNKNKIVIKNSQLWESETYPLRLWSFDYAMLNQIMDLYVRIAILNSTPKIVIIEYAMYELIKELNIPTHEVTGPIGIEGLMGLDKSQIYE